MFPVCNLLTRAESPRPACLWQAGLAPIFLRRTHVKIVIQIYKSRLVLSKEDRGFQNRPALKWPDHIESSTAKIEDSCVRFISSLVFSTTESFANSEFFFVLDYHPETKIPKNQFYDNLDEVSFNFS
ncbi:hypothetical protein LEP1GSC041_2125 [Leptospira noguchii str. 2006001870]|uniref:hypothetical protein n=1 Tax=Leptospira noguchii TaxID=28182 RepID=UPI000297D758|nr:hypothetical protein [Leptospira noguchii]EKR74310.1 hypothetical protein LEP1GSC041_2125 [Leptospira noguchii str. 2006001870]